MSYTRAPAGADTSNIPAKRIGGFIEIDPLGLKVYLIATTAGKSVTFDPTKTVYVFYTNNDINNFQNPFVRFNLDDGSFIELSDYAGDEYGTTNYFSDLTFIPDL